MHSSPASLTSNVATARLLRLPTSALHVPTVSLCCRHAKPPAPTPHAPHAHASAPAPDQARGPAAPTASVAPATAGVHPFWRFWWRLLGLPLRVLVSEVGRVCL